MPSMTLIDVDDTSWYKQLADPIIPWNQPANLVHL
jgi:hypothetical protein